MSFGANFECILLQKRRKWYHDISGAEAPAFETGWTGLIQERLGNRMEARYRTVSEACLLDLLLLGGWAFELECGGHAKALASTQASLESWIALGLPYARSERGERLYDPVEALNFMKWAGFKGLDRFWLERHVGTGRALVCEWADRRDGTLSPDGRSDACFHVKLQRSFDLRAFAPGTKLRLRMPVPLSSAYVRDIEVRTLVSPERQVELAVSDGRIEARLTAGTDPVLEIGAEVSFIAVPCPADTAPPAHDLDAAEAEIYLRPRDGLVRTTPRILTLARALAGPASAPWDSVRSFWNYMLDELSSGAVHYDQVDAQAPGDWVLESGWYDCQLGSALFVSLCRARGIPARIISGHFLYRLVPTRHYWAEAWIDGRGWLPFDLMCWDLSAGGRDARWRDHFAGKIDYRMVTQCFPKSFTGSMSVQLPAAWHMLQARCGKGIEISMVGLDGHLSYRDRISVLPP
jgi:Transglutaminase-like superfamily